MANVGRKLGVNIFSLMQDSGISREDMAQRIKISYRDMCRILEGKLLLAPDEIEQIASVLGKTKMELLEYDANFVVPELQYMKEFENIENLYKILDLLDDYIELKEAI